jgi:hypothetical protein
MMTSRVAVPRRRHRDRRRRGFRRRAQRRGPLHQSRYHPQRSRRWHEVGAVPVFWHRESGPSQVSVGVSGQENRFEQARRRSLALTGHSPLRRSIPAAPCGSRKFVRFDFIGYSGGSPKPPLTMLKIALFGKLGIRTPRAKKLSCQYPAAEKVCGKNPHKSPGKPKISGPVRLLGFSVVD